MRGAHLAQPFDVVSVLAALEEWAPSLLEAVLKKI
jgi:hypothetical protein